MIVKLKAVEIDDNYIYISNFVKNIAVRLSEIDEIQENPFINIHPIFIRFKKDTVFGSQIMFTPKGSYIFRQHPIVQELRDMAQQKASPLESTKGRRFHNDRMQPIARKSGSG